MYITAKTLDDLLLRVFKRLLNDRRTVNASKGDFSEQIGAVLKLSNPRARLSRTETRGRVFSCLGECLWYLSATDRLDFVQYYIKDYDKYSDDKQTLYGAYGPRLYRNRGINQLSSVVELLKRKQTSRQAVIQLFNAEDLLEHHKDIPCTCSLQFLVRNGKVNMVAHMRSNDAYKGLPHDVFAFTMIQELMARILELEVGSYVHCVGSLHLYEENRDQAQRFVDEGYQSTKLVMPPMPAGNPLPSLDKLLEIESVIRKGAVSHLDVTKLGLHDYWLDLIRLLQVFWLTKQKTRGAASRMRTVKGSMSSRAFDIYIDRKQKTSETLKTYPAQLPLLSTQDIER